jgi:hypothetical protein
LPQVLACCAIWQSEHWQIDLGFDEIFEVLFRNVRTPTLNALEIIDGATATDNVPPARLATHAHF